MLNGLGHGQKTAAAWDGFIGSIDELKLYNVVLTNGQVSKLFRDENKLSD